MNHQLARIEFELQQDEIAFEEARNKILYRHDGHAFLMYSAWCALVWLLVFYYVDASFFRQLYNQQLPGEIALFVVVLGFILVFCLGCLSVLLIAAVILLINESCLSYFVGLLYPSFAEHKKAILRFDFSTEPELAQLFSKLEEKRQSYELLKNEYDLSEVNLHKRMQSFIDSCEDKEVRNVLNELFLNKQKF